METEKNVQKLVELERHVRALDTLIKHVGSMSDEELKEAWPRILKARRAIEIHSEALTRCETTFRMPVINSEEDNSSFRERFWRRVWNDRNMCRTNQ